MEEDENQDPQQNETSGDESGLDQCTESHRDRGAEQVRLILQPLGRSPHSKQAECNTSTQANCSTSPCAQQVKNTLQHLRDMNATTRQPNDCGKTCQRDSRKQKQIRRRKTCTPMGSNAITRSSPEIAVASLHGTAGSGNPEKEVVSVLLSHLTSALQHIGSTYGATLQTRLSPEPEPVADLGASYFGRLEPENTEASTDLQEDGISSLGIRVVRHPGFTLKKDRAWRYKKSVSAGLPSPSQRVPFHSILREALPYRDCLCSGGLSSVRNNENQSLESRGNGNKKTNNRLRLLDSYILSPASLDCLRQGLLRNMGCLEGTETLGDFRMRNQNIRTEMSGQPVTSDLKAPIFSPNRDLATKRRLDPLDVELSCLSQRSNGLGVIVNPSTDQKPSADSPLKRLVGDAQGSHPSEGANWGLVLGNGSGISNGQQRPLNGGGCSNSGNQPSSSSMSQTCPEKAESSSVPCQQNVTNRITYSDGRLGPDVYDPFNPTDEENVNGEFIGGDFSPKERTELDDDDEEPEAEEEEDEKYDPFDPTGSGASSNNLSPVGDDSEGELKIVSDAGLTEEEECLSPEYEEDLSPESTTCVSSDVELQIDCRDMVKPNLEPDLYSSPDYRDLELESQTGFAQGITSTIETEFENDSKLQTDVQLDSISQPDTESVDSENELASEGTYDAVREEEELVLSPARINYSSMQSPEPKVQMETEALKLSLKSTQKEALISFQEGALLKSEQGKDPGLETKASTEPGETTKEQPESDSQRAPRCQKDSERTVSEPMVQVETLEPQIRSAAKSSSSSRVTSKSTSRQRLRTEVVRKDKSDAKVHSKAEHKSKSTSASRYHHKSHRTVERKDNLVFTVNVSKWPEDAHKYEDSEIEEGEIVQQDEENFSPARTFRSRGRIFERLRGVEGDDFISLHADSDEGALQIDLGENPTDGGRKKLDHRRKVSNQQREKYIKHPRSPAESKGQSGSHSESSSRSRKKRKREHKKARSKDRKRSRSQSREHKRSTSRTRLRIHRKKSRSRSRSWERRRSSSRSRHKVSRSRTHSREHRRSRSWSPSISTSISAIGSMRASAERWKSRAPQSRESGSYRRSRSSSKSRKERRKKEKHREQEAAKRRRHSRSRSKERSQREKRPHSPSPRRSKERTEKEKDRSRERNPVSEKKHEKTVKGRRDSRIVVPPSIQELNDDDILIKARSITRTITVNPGETLEDQEDSMEVAALSPNRETMYDSDELGFENSFSDVEPGDHMQEGRVPGKGQGSKNERRSGHEKSHRAGEPGSKLAKIKDRKRAHPDEKSGKEKRRKKLADGQKGASGADSTKTEKKGKEHLISSQTGKKIKSVPKDSKQQAPRKVKLQSKVAVLIRDGVSCAASMKDDRGKGGGLIGVKFSRDRESRSPFMKTEDKIHDSKPSRHRADSSDNKGIPSRAAKGKATAKPRSAAKKTKAASGKAKGSGKKKKEAKPKTALKKAVSGSSSSSKDSSPFRIKEELSWSSSEKSEDKGNLPSPAKDAVEQGLSPLSQISESAAQPLEAAFVPKEPPLHQPPPPPPPQQQKDYHEHSDTSKVNGDKPRAPGKPLSWDLQTGGGMLALTALLFKMEEANRAKAQDSIQAITQILSQTKPPAPPVPTSLSAHLPVSQPAPKFLRQGSLSMMGCTAGPTALSGSAGQPPATTSGKLYTMLESNESSKMEGTTSSDGNMDSDRYLKKLHTQERAVEEVKLAIKPFYQRKEINKDDYKDILRKAVHKICHSKSGEINPVKVANLVKAYVEKYKYARRHSKRPEEGGRQSNGKEAGKLEKHGKASAQT